MYEFARQRVTLCKDGLPERTIWLVIKRTVGAEPAYADYSSHAPASPPGAALAGSVGFAGRWNSASKKVKLSEGWLTMKCGSIRAGTTIC